MLVFLVAAVALAGSAGNASTTTSRQDLTIPMADGTPIAATLWLPTGAPPAGGWPAIVLFHGLGGSREDMNKLAQLAFLPSNQYAVLAYDARGHGQSGGLIGIDGPNEISDAKAMFAWLAAQPDVNRKEIGAFGISLGGGAVWNSLVAGVPWAAIEVCETWTNLATALAPQGLAKSGAIAGFINEMPVSKFDAAVLNVGRAALAGDMSSVAGFAAARSSIQKLKGVKTPVFMMQGRRDFAFGIDQATNAWPLLAGPKHLWLGLHGHPPSSFPAPDTVAMMTEGRQWFDHYLRGIQNGIDRKAPVEIAPATWKGKTNGFPAVPTTDVFSDAVGGRSTIAQSGRIERRVGRLTVTPLETFGSPSVRIDSVSARGGWSRIVAVLSAIPPHGSEIVVGGGGVPVVTQRHTYTIRLNSTVTFIPKGSKLMVTVGSSSLAQNPSNLLYLDFPMPATARLSVGAMRLRIPELPIPVSG